MKAMPTVRIVVPVTDHNPHGHMLVNVADRTESMVEHQDEVPAVPSKRTRAASTGE